MKETLASISVTELQNKQKWFAVTPEQVCLELAPRGTAHYPFLQWLRLDECQILFLRPRDHCLSATGRSMNRVASPDITVSRSLSGFEVLHQLPSQLRNQSDAADVVLGLHAGEEENKLLMFLKSLRSSCSNCFIVLFCRDTSQSVQKLLTNTNAWCIPYRIWQANSTLGPACDHR